jgi:ribosomal protein S11
MILLKILPKIKTINVVRIKYYIYQLKQLIEFFNYIKSFKKFKYIKKLISMFILFKFSKNLNRINLNEDTQKNAKQNLIKYIINIHFSNTNTLVNVTDIKGNPLILLTSGLIKLKGKEKKTQPTALLNIFKVLLLKARFLFKTPVALHFKNVKTFYESFLINSLKNKVFIKTIRSYNLVAHNGCRLKKLSRFKRRTKKK